MEGKWIFRGFDAIGKKGLVYGDLVHNQKVTVDGLEPRVMVGGYEVVPESVGICTGMKESLGWTFMKRTSSSSVRQVQTSRKRIMSQL